MESIAIVTDRILPQYINPVVPYSDLIPDQESEDNHNFPYCSVPFASMNK